MYIPLRSDTLLRLIDVRRLAMPKMLKRCAGVLTTGVLTVLGVLGIGTAAGHPDWDCDADTGWNLGQF
jgi:hypothetical protein